MSPRDVPDLCKSTILFLRSALSSSDLLIVLRVGRSNECCQTIHSYVGTGTLPAVVNQEYRDYDLSGWMDISDPVCQFDRRKL